MTVSTDGSARVFDIVPLQRLAERVADRAMPGVQAVGQIDDGEGLLTYRRMATKAWADGSLSGDERRMLGSARNALRIDAGTALRIDREGAP